MRKTNALVSDLVRHKPGFTATKMARDLIFRFKKVEGGIFSIYVAKTKVLISCAVTAQLICVFVFAYAKCLFSHDTAHLVKTTIQKSASRENLSSWFPPRSDTNKAVQP